MSEYELTPQQSGILSEAARIMESLATYNADVFNYPDQLYDFFKPKFRPS